MGPEHGSSWMRLTGLLRKEVLQIRRDPSSIVLALILPVVLLFLFGYGVSLDPEEVPVAVVLGDRGAAARELAARFQQSRYFQPTMAESLAEAETLVRENRVQGIVHIQDNFADDVATRGRAPVQLIVTGDDANRARLVQGYTMGVVQQWLAVRHARGEPAARPLVTVQPRIWFNESGESRNFLVPGLMTLIMTLTGTLLTALVIAREWERGTMEALLVTPIRTDELLLAKIIPYFALGMMGMMLSVAVAVALFGVPIRGSFWLLTVLSAIFLLAALGLGLAISSLTKVQFIAAQFSVVIGFLPAFFLSGLLFDLDSTPRAIQTISYVIPARYFVAICHTLFLAGDVWPVLLPSAAVLTLMAVVLLGLARRNLGKRLEGE